MRPLAPYEDRRKYVLEIRPAEIIELSRRKIPAAREKQRQYDRERRRLRLEGKALPQLETYRKDFMEEGQRKTALKLAEDTAGTIRRPGIRTRETVQMERMGADLTEELDSQVRQNFRTQSARTVVLVEALFSRFKTDLKNAVNNGKVPKYIWEDGAFLEEFRRMRNVTDYIEIISERGCRYALDSAQAATIGNDLHLGRAKTKFLVDIVKELEEQLEKLCRQAKVNDNKGTEMLWKMTKLK